MDGTRSSPLPQTARFGRARARERCRAMTFTEVAMPWCDGPYKGRLGRRIGERTRLAACVPTTNETLVMLAARQ